MKSYEKMDRLEDTAPFMLSADYRDRFAAEYWQLSIRQKRLSDMLKALDEQPGAMPHDCPLPLLEEQHELMLRYLKLLEQRARIEGIDLDGGHRNAD